MCPGLPTNNTWPSAHASQLSAGARATGTGTGAPGGLLLLPNAVELMGRERGEAVRRLPLILCIRWEEQKSAQE